MSARPLDPSGTLALVRAARSGDDEAFRALVRQVYDTIHRWALVGLGDPDEADEAVQRVLLRMHCYLGTFREEARFETWLYRITSSVVAEIGREGAAVARRRERFSREPAERPSPEDALADELEAAELSALVLEHFRDLPERQREVFALVDVEGREPKEVAEMLDLNANTVRSHLFRARGALRERLLKRHPGLAEERIP